MSSFINFLKKWYVLVLECVLVVICGLLIWGWDSIQETILPEKFWVEKVKELKQDIKMDHYRIHDLEISLERENRMLDLDLKQARSHAFSFGHDADESKSGVLKKHRKTIAHLKKELDLKTQSLLQKEKKLQSAQETLQDLTTSE